MFLCIVLDCNSYLKRANAQSNNRLKALLATLLNDTFLDFTFILLLSQ